MPLRVSAVCWTRHPTSVTGETSPARGIAMNSTGRPSSAHFMVLSEVTSLHFSGEVGQHENMAKGFALSASRVPRTASWRSAMTSKPAILKAPVTIGFVVSLRRA